MKFLSLALTFAATIQSISACGRIYGQMVNAVSSDSYQTVMFDNCADRCSGSRSGSMWSQQSKIDMPCNPGYSLQMYFNGQQAFYTTGWGKTHLYMPVTIKAGNCGKARISDRKVQLKCTQYKYDCWAFIDDCNGCGGYVSGSSGRCKAWDAMDRSALRLMEDPNPEWARNKTIVNEMVKNGSLVLEGLALEVYNQEMSSRGGNARFKDNSFNITEASERFFANL